MKQTIMQDQNTNRINFMCELHMQIAMRNYIAYLFQWEMNYGLELFSTEVRTAQLKVEVHVPLMWWKLLMNLLYGRPCTA
jgi:hypothetical protein